MKYILAILLIATSLQAQPEYVWSLISRANYEANESEYLTAMMTLIQKRDWGDSSDTNNVKHQINYTAKKDGADYCLFGYATCKMGEVLLDDWNDYTSAITGFHIKDTVGLQTIQSLWNFTLTTNSWYTDSIPFVADNKQENEKGKGFSIAYVVDQFNYADTDKANVCDLIGLPDTEANRATIDSEFDKDSYVSEQNTNVAIYVWSTEWDKYPAVSRKECKQVAKKPRICGIMRDKDIPKVQKHYKIKEKKK